MSQTSKCRTKYAGLWRNCLKMDSCVSVADHCVIASYCYLSSSFAFKFARTTVWTSAPAMHKTGIFNFRVYRLIFMLQVTQADWKSKFTYQTWRFWRLKSRSPGQDNPEYVTETSFCDDWKKTNNLISFGRFIHAHTPSKNLTSVFQFYEKPS